MSKKEKKANKPTCEEVSTLAYHLYEQEGRPHGRHVDHWLQAELLLSAQAAGKKSSNAAKANRFTPQIAPQNQSVAANMLSK